VRQNGWPPGWSSPPNHRTATHPLGTGGQTGAVARFRWKDDREAEAQTEMALVPCTNRGPASTKNMYQSIMVSPVILNYVNKLDSINFILLSSKINTPTKLLCCGQIIFGRILL